MRRRKKKGIRNGFGYGGLKLDERDKKRVKKERKSSSRGIEYCILIGQFRVRLDLAPKTSKSLTIPLHVVFPIKLVILITKVQIK